MLMTIVQELRNYTIDDLCTYRDGRLVINRKLRRLRSRLYNIGQMVYHYNIMYLLPIHYTHKIIIMYNFFFFLSLINYSECLCCERRITILCRKPINISMAYYNNMQKQRIMVLIVIKNYARTYFNRNEMTRINDVRMRSKS